LVVREERISGRPELSEETDDFNIDIGSVRRSGGCQQFDDLIDGLVGAVMFRVGLVVEVAVGEWSAQTFVEE
jgi:hypothetical protein